MLLAWILRLADVLTPSPLRALLRSLLDNLRSLHAIRTPHASRGDKHLTIFNLPPEARRRIYWHVLHDDPAPNVARNPEISPHVPVANFGLLHASRRVHAEAVPVLYETVHLGSDARKAFEYLEFLGPARIARIRYLGLYHHCHHRCDYYRAGRAWASLSEPWDPVFNLFRQSYVWLRSVDVHFRPCTGDTWRGVRCRLAWKERADGHWGFWAGLRKFSRACEIHFVDDVPEYYVRRHARQLGWHMHGTTKGGFSDPVNGPEVFSGRLVNPRYMDDYSAVRLRHWFKNQGVNVSQRLHEMGTERVKRMSLPDAGEGGLSCCVVKPVSKCQPRRHFFDLPPEIRQHIYDSTCEWAYRAAWPAEPARWNAGAGLLLTSKQVSAEALPSVYRNFRIYGGSPCRTLGRLGTNLAHVRHLEIQFSCYCPWGGLRFQHNNDTIYAAQHFVSIVGHPDATAVGDYRAVWAMAMCQIRSLELLAELTVTFQTCCRTAARMSPSGSLAPAGLPDKQRHCLALESSFVNRLAHCTNIQKLTLAGNVPPSLGVRLSVPYPNCGLTVQWVSRQMAAYMAVMERKAWLQARMHGKAFQLPSPPYPGDTSRPDNTPVPHFVLVKMETARNRWAEHVEPEEWATPPGLGMELARMPLSRRSWREVAEHMDFANGGSW